MTEWELDTGPAQRSDTLSSCKRKQCYMSSAETDSETNNGSTIQAIVKTMSIFYLDFLYITAVCNLFLILEAIRDKKMLSKFICRAK